MNKKQQQDKQLLANIDKAAAGEKLPEESGLDKDTRAALEMTREMAAWPKSPSKEFKAQLKAEITHRVVEQQKRTSRNGETRNTVTFCAVRPGSLPSPVSGR